MLTDNSINESQRRSKSRSLLKTIKLAAGAAVNQSGGIQQIFVFIIPIALRYGSNLPLTRNLKRAKCPHDDHDGR